MERLRILITDIWYMFWDSSRVNSDSYRWNILVILAYPIISFSVLIIASQCPGRFNVAILAAAISIACIGIVFIAGDLIAFLLSLVAVNKATRVIILEMYDNNLRNIVSRLVEDVIDTQVIERRTWLIERGLQEIEIELDARPALPMIFKIMCLRFLRNLFVVLVLLSCITIAGIMIPELTIAKLLNMFFLSFLYHIHMVKTIGEFTINQNNISVICSGIETIAIAFFNSIMVGVIVTLSVYGADRYRAWDMIDGLSKRFNRYIEF